MAMNRSWRAARLSVLTGIMAGVVLVSGCNKPDEKAGDKKAETTAKKDATKETPKKPEPTGPVAKVNGTTIERAALNAKLERTRKRFQRAGRQVPASLETRLRENLVRKLVENELIAQRAKAEGITVTDADLEKRFAEHKKRYQTEENFKKFLERSGQTEANVKADMRQTALRDMLFTKLLKGDEVSDADAKKYYDDNVKRYLKKEQVKASHILFKVGRGMSDVDKKAKLKAAKDVLKLAKKKGADFAKLAKEHSEGPTATRGGDLGEFSRGRMVKAFEDAAFKAKKGQVVGPVETQFGFHIIKVFDKQPARQRTFDEVKENIKASLRSRKRSQATRELLKSLRESAKIEVLEPGVSLEPKAPRPSKGMRTLTPEQMKQMREQAKTRVLKMQGKDKKEDAHAHGQH